MNLRSKTYSGIPETGYLRLWQIIGDAKATPPVPPLIPIGKSSWWQGIRAGRFPKPIKIAARTTAWRVEDIRSFLNSLGTEAKSSHQNMSEVGV